MTSLKRNLTLAFALSLSLSALPAAQAQASSPVEVTFWSWYLSPKFDGYLKDTISAFEAANPGIKVKWFDKQDSMVQDFISSVNLGSAPDVVNLNIDETAKAAQNGFLAPLEGLVSRAVLNSYYPQPLSNFASLGQHYGLPWYGWLNEGVLVYNPDLLKKAGINSIPKTMDEMMDAARKIKTATGAYGWVPALKDPNTASMLGYFNADGLGIYGADGKAVFNSSAHVALLQKYIELFKGGFIPEDALRREAFQLGTEMYAQNKVAMIIGGPQALTRIRDNNKDLYAKTAVGVAPLGKAKIQTGGGMALVVPKASKHTKEAAMFAAFMTNNTNQMTFAKMVPIVPTTKAAQNDPFFKQKSSDAISKATSMIGAQGRFINPGYRAPGNSDDLYKNFNDNIEAAMLGKKTAQQALDDSVAFWNANMKK